MQGLPCEHDADCGPQLRCIDGYCDGLGDPSLCGNGLREVGEECDDGNANDGDGCQADCSLPAVCGDGLVQEGEACDDGNAVETDECTTRCTLSPEAPTLELSLAQVKQFEFSWEPVAGAAYYRLFERANKEAEFLQVGGDLVGNSYSLTVPLHLRVNASYKLSACSLLRCVESEVVVVFGNLAEAVGYFKASNTGPGDAFGASVALSADGNTLAIGASAEGSGATGVNGDQANDSALYSGAAYMFVQADGFWSQQAYIKASNAEEGDSFGYSVALSRNGDTLAVGAIYESSSATGIGGDADDDAAEGAGAVYLFVRAGTDWSQQAYVKASNTDASDLFGWQVALSDEGDTLAVGAIGERSNAAGVDGEQDDDSVAFAGAVYVYVRGGSGWSPQAYIKATNTNAFGTSFGYSVALSGDGTTLAVGAPEERSSATGVNGDQDNLSLSDAGAAYLFVRAGKTWSHQAYVKASNTGEYDRFGCSVGLSRDGNTLAVGARGESSNAIGIDGGQNDDSTAEAGAAYLFARTDGIWLQQAYVKPSTTQSGYNFGTSVALSRDGNFLAVGAPRESSHAAGIDGEQNDVSAPQEGAVYLLTRDGEGWLQRAYVKPPVSAAYYFFGSSVALSNHAEILVSGAYGEGSSAKGIGGDQFGDGSSLSGAVYVY